MPAALIGMRNDGSSMEAVSRTKRRSGADAAGRRRQGAYMGKLYCIMGKSSTGKDSIFAGLLRREDLHLRRVIPYTTRPIRRNEEHGREYFFCDKAHEEKLLSQGKIIECRTYHTWHGDWDYFTADDGQIDLAAGSFLIIGTLESYGQLRSYYKNEKVLPIYIEVEDGVRLVRALERERRQQEPKYEELCRRFLADQEDFSEEKLSQAGIERRFINRDFDTVMDEIAAYIAAHGDGLPEGQ